MQPVTLSMTDNDFLLIGSQLFCKTRHKVGVQDLSTKLRNATENVGVDVSVLYFIHSAVGKIILVWMHTFAFLCFFLLWDIILVMWYMVGWI